MAVLIITKSNDNECISSVVSAIEARGGKAFRLDTDLFPTEVRATARYDDVEQLTLTSHQGELKLCEVTAVWYRRTRFGGGLPERMDHQLRQASVGEIQATVHGLIASLDAFQMDPWAIFRHASNKQLQIQVARAIGLDTPRTLITNDPQSVRDFAAHCQGGIVTKMLSSFAILDEAGAEKVVFTTPVKPDDLDDLDGLRYCPMTFQEHLSKERELRVTIVGNQIFTAAINPNVLTRSQDDWRREGEALVDQWERYELPNDVAGRLLRLMDQFDLNYGAVDLIVTPEGRHVFLEVNPVGEYFWLDRYPGLPISEAIADLLLDRLPRRARSAIRKMATLG